MTQPQQFIKAHATENDFVVLVDVDNQLDLAPEQVAWLCNRRAGIGGDGLLRVVRIDGTWFMDYRNADGSIAEMCGNGIRAFSHVLKAEGLEPADDFDVHTRAGMKRIHVVRFDERDAVVAVGMGTVRVGADSWATIGSHTFEGVAVDVGNPHLAAVVPGMTPEELAAMELSAPEFDAAVFPEGVNVELLTEARDGQCSMRVWERGVGETRSCGTGTVAAATAALRAAGETAGTVTVRVPGGAVEVAISEDPANSEQTARMTGPSRIVAHGDLILPGPAADAVSPSGAQ